MGISMNAMEMGFSEVVYDQYTPHVPDPILGSPWEVENGAEHADDLEVFAAPVPSPPAVLWHITPKAKRRDLEQGGLLANTTPNAANLCGVYLTANPREWLELHDEVEVDFWMVQTEGLILHHDPEMGMNGDYVFLGNISPGRIKRYEG
jgi:hypothetical protein